MDENARIRVAVDAMGGDNAPTNEVAAALAALLDESIEIILVGRSHDIMAELPTGAIPDRLSILEASDVVTMSDEPASIVKNRKESSLYKGVEMMRAGNADAFISAGNTGGVMATSTMLCGRLKGVSRPTIGSFFPSKTGVPTLVLDVGANVDSKPKFLRDYAVMGSVYTELLLGKPNPTVGLLNVGEEKSKGSEVAKEAYELLQTAPVNFVGNVEGRDILMGTVDVVVCDGFVGNIVLKFAESVIGFLKARFTDLADEGLFYKVGLGLFKPILRKALRGMDYQEYGGVPLLGINGVAIIGHGSSSTRAIEMMIKRAVEVVRLQVNDQIQLKLVEGENTSQ